MKKYRYAVVVAARTLVFGASAHLLLLAGYAICRQDYEIMNVWNILDLDFLFPGIEKGPVNFWLSYLSLGVFYALVYWWGKKRR